MLRKLIISCLFLVVGLTLAASQDVQRYSKCILGKWSSSRSGTLTIFHGDGSWGVQRDGPEEIHGRWWIKGSKLFLTYPVDKGAGTPVHIRTGKYTITFASNDRFITETAGYKETYHRIR
jgi:hypothetical protein